MIMKWLKLDSLRQHLGRKTVSVLIGVGVILLLLTPELALFSFMLDAVFLDTLIFLIGFQCRMYLHLFWINIRMLVDGALRVARSLIFRKERGALDTIEDGACPKNPTEFIKETGQ